MTAFEFLQNKKRQHSKVKDVQYKKLETQKYMTSPVFNDQEVSLLYAIRARALECKSIYKNKYKNDDLLYSICSLEEDDQPHIMQCKVLNSKIASNDVVREKIEYNNIFSVCIISVTHLKCPDLRQEIEYLCILEERRINEDN